MHNSISVNLVVMLDKTLADVGRGEPVPIEDLARRLRELGVTGVVMNSWTRAEDRDPSNASEVAEWAVCFSPSLVSRSGNEKGATG